MVISLSSTLKDEVFSSLGVSIKTSTLYNGCNFCSWDGVTGGVYLHDGLATGLETLHRVGDATLSNVDTIIFFESDCGINNVRLIRPFLYYFNLINHQIDIRLLLVMQLVFCLWISDRPRR